MISHLELKGSRDGGLSERGADWRRIIVFRIRNVKVFLKGRGRANRRRRFGVKEMDIIESESSQNRQEEGGDPTRKEKGLSLDT